MGRGGAWPRLWGIALLLAIASLSAPAQAQPGTVDRILEQQRRADELLRQEQLRQQELLRQQDVRRKLPPPSETPSRVEPEIKDSGKCFTISAIELEGATLLDAQDRRKLTADYVGDCIGLQKIQLLLRDITNHYVDRGYITTRAYIPEQNLESGTLRLLVVEGTVEKVIKVDEKDRTSLLTAFPGIEGELLNLRDIEQGLDQINRLRANNATMEITPGEGTGGSIVNVRNERAFPLHQSLSADNSGSESTGTNRGTLAFDWDNPLGLNDAWSVNATRNIDDNGNDDLSESYFSNFSVPYGYWLLAGSYSYTAYESVIEGAAESFDSDGSTKTANLNLSRVVARAQSRKITLTAGITHKDIENFIQDTKLVTSSRKLSVFDVSAVTVLFGAGGTWVLETGVARGLDLWGAEEFDSAGRAGVPRAEFTSARLSLSYSRPLTLGGRELFWSSVLQSQYGFDYLPGSEQISVGGRYTVRGYNDTAVSGDRGAFWRNDLSIGLPYEFGWLGRLSPYVALDAGSVESREGQSGGSLVGAAFGLRSSGRINFDLVYSLALDQSDSVENFGVEDDSVYFRFSISI